jgi:hypothetical protein
MEDICEGRLVGLYHRCYTPVNRLLRSKQSISDELPSPYPSALR